jgi:hypothetical protein
VCPGKRRFVNAGNIAGSLGNVKKISSDATSYPQSGSLRYKQLPRNNGCFISFLCYIGRHSQFLLPFIQKGSILVSKIEPFAVLTAELTEKELKSQLFRTSPSDHHYIVLKLGRRLPQIKNQRKSAQSASRKFG